MNGNCHFIFGAAVGITTALFLNTDSTDTTLLISTCLIGSIFPDIDNPRSHFGQLTKPVSTGVAKISALFGKKGAHHRSIFHDIGLAALLLFVCYRLFPPLMGFFIGMISHLFLDAFNPSGVPVLFGVKRFHLAKVESGSKAAVVVSWVCTFLVLGAGAYTLIF